MVTPNFLKKMIDFRLLFASLAVFILFFALLSFMRIMRL